MVSPGISQQVVCRGQTLLEPWQTAGRCGAVDCPAQRRRERWLCKVLWPVACGSIGIMHPLARGGESGKGALSIRQGTKVAWPARLGQSRVQRARGCLPNQVYNGAAAGAGFMRGCVWPGMQCQRPAPAPLGVATHLASVLQPGLGMLPVHPHARPLMEGAAMQPSTVAPCPGSV